MIILNKKRLLAMISMMCIGAFVFSFKIATANEDKAIATISLPVSNKVIVVDAGHGTPDEGAESTSRNYGSCNKFSNCIKTTNTT